MWICSAQSVLGFLLYVRIDSVSVKPKVSELILRLHLIVPHLPHLVSGSHLLSRRFVQCPFKVYRVLIKSFEAWLYCSQRPDYRH